MVVAAPGRGRGQSRWIRTNSHAKPASSGSFLVPLAALARGKSFTEAIRLGAELRSEE
jgi:hypothetical protein